eukprot:TRINITY_DN4817_c0_g2_i1.p1 TRINITY_DN4817_c0_g2~~TRINITY_DN4817_c0_g2_i1.p1  ORF type:complete len:251 (-),score=21.39 TRINITY_DN4817_c0_g2_i1:204-881(-)
MKTALRFKLHNPAQTKRKDRQLCATKELEYNIMKSKQQICIGIDEVGRGCLAGPVVSAACFIPLDLQINDINDSKQLSSKKREKIYSELINHPEIYSGIGVVDHKTIDQINIRQATFKAMEIAFINLQKSMEMKNFCLLVDGHETPPNFSKFQTKCVKSGDKICYCIAAASIIAKVYRDALMVNYEDVYSQYGFINHKGYPTVKHRQAIKEYGPCEIHRRSFKLI